MNNILYYILYYKCTTKILHSDNDVVYTRAHSVYTHRLLSY